MIKKTALVVVVVSAGVALTVAQASAATSHHFHQTGDGAGLLHPPFVPGAPIFAGTLGSTGVIIEKRALKAGSQTSFGGTVTVFGPQGSFSGTITTGTFSSSGATGPPQSATLKAKITGGSSLYKSATGTVTETDALISGSPGFYKIVVNGTIKY